MRFRIVVRNSGILNLTNVAITDTVNGSNYWPPASAACPTRPTSIPIGAAQYVCDYTITAPSVPGSGTSFNDTNIVTVNANEISPATDFVTTVVDRPAELDVFKFVSPYQQGDDGDGVPSFGIARSISIGLNDLVGGESVWYRLVVRNVGGKPATGLTVTDSNGPLPVNADCPALPSDLAPGASAAWDCRYKGDPIGAPGTLNNTLVATATNVAADPTDSTTVTVVATACTASNDRVIPNLIGLTKAQAQAAWAAANMTGTLTTWGSGGDEVVTQSVQAYRCVRPNADMTITNLVTP